MFKEEKLKKLLLLGALLLQHNNLILLNLGAKRLWTQLYYSEEERTLHGFYTKVFKLMKENNNDEFRKITRMGVKQFMFLVNLLKNRLTKKSIRKPIEPECRLVVTLMFLAQGTNFISLAWTFRMGASTCREIVYETCEIIWEELCCIYLAPPNTDEWKRISEDFYSMTGMPHCVGAIDGKHVRIKSPPNAGSLYFNYKKYHSIILLASCDSNYCFTTVNIGAYGGQSDSGVLRASSFGKQLLGGTINLPADENLPHSNVKCSYFFVGDAAFPLRKNIMRPYPGSLLPADKDNFNKTLSKARVKIENTFGIMTMRWRVMLSVINCFPENAIKIIQAVVVLHNFIKMNDGEYCPQNYLDSFHGDRRIDGLWRKEPQRLEKSKLFTRFNAPKHAFALRDTLKEYLVHK